jgi:hypothetical protein
VHRREGIRSKKGEGREGGDFFWDFFGIFELKNEGIKILLKMDINDMV